MKTTSSRRAGTYFPVHWKASVIRIIDEWIASHHVTREDFSELKTIVAELAVAQKELAQAQKRTEQRVDELAQAQKRTEQRVDELAQAQKRTEDRLEKLIVTVEKLTEEMIKIKEQLGGLSDSFGYSLENKAIHKLPDILGKEGYEFTGNLERKYIEIKGYLIEVNIIGKVRKGNEEFILLGEATNRLRSKKINKFIANCEKIGGKQLRILISHILPPPFEVMLKENNIRFIPSYMVE